MKKTVSCLLIVFLLVSLNVSLASETFDLASLTLDQLRQLQSDVSSEIANRLALQNKNDETKVVSTKTDFDSPTGHTIRELFPCQDLANAILKETGLISLDQPIPENRLNRVTHLNWSNIGNAVIDSFEGIQYLYGLNSFEPPPSATFKGKIKLPDGFYNLKNLSYFCVEFTRGNIIVDWDRIYKMESLYDLCIYGKDVTSVPSSISRLTRLKELQISNTSITDLPDSISELTNIEKLILCKNEYLSTIPNCVFKLKNLKKLDLSYTMISEIPEDISELNKLTELNISYTKIKTLPANMYALNLYKFNTDGLTLDQ